MNPQDLPVYQAKDRILQGLEENQVIIIESPTGSGKTTQLPLILHEAGYTARGLVGVTQPRRIATLSVCDYIARQIGSPVPGLVGYKMRFEDNTLPETRMKIMTDGTLLQEIKNDPTLNQYSIIMVDEAHERSLNIDFILGLLKGVLTSRPEFKVIISSATINAAAFSAYFRGAPVISIETPVFPVTMIYDPPAVEGDPEVLVAKIVSIVERVVSEGRRGDILIFLPGEKIINDTIATLNTCSVRGELKLLPLYGRLSKEEQERIFIVPERSKTKIVVSTNIAETSVTIDGVTTVIDSGLAKLNHYNPRTFTSALIESEISKASANQRRGRAGRTQPGVCYRLYGRKSFEERPAFTKEEIYRTDLAEVVLRMAELGIRNFYSFDFISSPGRKGIQGAVETLKLLDALDEENGLTSIGEMMTPFPLMPRHARMIVEAIHRYPEVLRETIIGTSFLSTNSPYLLPQGEEMEARKAHHHFRDKKGDFVAYLKLFKAFKNSGDKEKFCKKYYLEERAMVELVNIQEQLEDIVSSLGIPVLEGGALEDYLCACGRGLIQFVCVNDRRSYRSLTADRILIHPGSTMFREDLPYLVAGEIVRTSQTYARSVSPLTRELVNRISPDLVSRLGSKGNEKESPKVGGENEVRLGKASFPIVATRKGKVRLAQIDWSVVWKALKDVDPKNLPDYKNQRGSLYYGGQEVLTNLPISTIVQIVLTFNPKKDLLQGCPGKTYQVDKDRQLRELAQKVDILLKPTRSGKGNRAAFKVISLQTNGKGEYWFKEFRDFMVALHETLASLEALADEVGEGLDERQWRGINQAYRMADSFLNY